MRQYLIGVLLILVQLNSLTFCEKLHKNQENRKSFVNLETPDDTSEQDSSISSSSSEEEDLDINDDVLISRKIPEHENESSNDESDPYDPMDDVAYWDAIYGNEEIPDYEVPPTIEGDTIFMDLDDLTDAWDEPEKLVKRSADESEVEFGNSSSSLKQIGIGKKSVDGNTQFYGSKGSSRTISLSSPDHGKPLRTSENLTKSKLLDMDVEMESGLEDEHQCPLALVSRSIKSTDLTDSLLDSTKKIIQAKKDLIDVAGHRASVDEINDAVYRTIDAKKDFIDSAISAKAEAIKSTDHTDSLLDSTRKIIQAKKDLIDVAGHRASVDEINDAVYRTIGAKKDFIDSAISAKAEAIKSTDHTDSLLDSTRKIIQAKKDLIDVAGHRASVDEINDAVYRTIDAKKDFIDSAISANTEALKKKKAFALSSNSHFDQNQKLPIQSHSSLKEFRDLSYGTDKCQVIDNLRSKSIRDRHHFSSSIRRSKNQKSSVHSCVSSTSNIDKGGKIGVTSSSCGSHQKIDSCSNLSHKVKSSSRISSDIELKSKTSQGGKIYSVIPEVSKTETGTIPEDEKRIKISGTEKEDKSISIGKSCAEGYCGITGRLRVDLNTRLENSHQHQKQMKTIVTSKIPEDPQDDEEITEINHQTPIDEVVLIKPEVEDENAEKNQKTEDTITELKIVEEKPVIIVKKVQSDDEEDNKATKLYLDKPEETLVKNEEEESEDRDYKKLEEDQEKQTVVNEGLEETEDSIAIEKSSNDLDRLQIFEETIPKDKEEERIAAIDPNIGLQASVKIGNSEKSSSYHGASTYKDTFKKYYTHASDQHQVSQKLHKTSHLQCCQGDAHLTKNIEHFKANEAFFNTRDGFINLDLNCSGIIAVMKPECQRLNTRLWYPRDTDMPITLRTVKTYLNQGQELAIEMQSRAKWLCDEGFVPKVHSPEMLHLINSMASEDVVALNHESELSLFGIKLLQQKLSTDHDVTPNTFTEFLKHHAFRVIGNGFCYTRPKRCPVNQIYRSFDGSCNNQHHPTWGQTNTAFVRILPARYNDGVHEPPKSVTGNELPNPRSLSAHFFGRKSIHNTRITLAVMQWGQLISHDLAMQTTDQTVRGGIECCDDGKRQLPKNLQHHSCLPIDIPADDVFYSRFGIRCMNFVRSMTAPREDCTLGPAEQLNTVSSYIDASPLYGSTKEVADQLRSFEDGRMSISIRRGRELLPTTANRSRFCDVMSPNEKCYYGGDLRASQNPQLAILQTCLLREHNRIADKLARLNTHWNDEDIFQKTRQIVIAEYQHITYNEWLPAAIGTKYCRKHRLKSQCNYEMSWDYNPRISAATINSFTAAAFRFFHNMIQGNLNLCPESRKILQSLRMSNHYFRPQIIEQYNNFDDLLRGLVTQPIQQSDLNFDPEITEYLFRSKHEFGLDLTSFDIQRGRDHGLRGYNAYRKICGLKPAMSFDDLHREISQETIEKLKKFYDHVDDIDLITGLASEKKCPDSLLGPVSRCLIAEQFFRSKVADRHFYNNGGHPHSFTQEQFEEITKASLARLLCDTADNLIEIQPRAFKLISSKNPLTSCSALPKIDLSLWKE